MISAIFGIAGATTISLGALIFTAWLYKRDWELAAIMILVDILIIFMSLCTITDIGRCGI
jgi:hypothetical protein